MLSKHKAQYGSCGVKHGLIVTLPVQKRCLYTPGAVPIQHDGVILADLDELAGAEVLLCRLLKGHADLLTDDSAASQNGNVLVCQVTRMVVTTKSSAKNCKTGVSHCTREGRMKALNIVCVRIMPTSSLVTVPPVRMAMSWCVQNEWVRPQKAEPNNADLSGISDDI